MARRKNEDLKQHWICEDCEKVAVGKDPPDECAGCCHKFFHNAHDLAMEAKAEA